MCVPIIGAAIGAAASIGGGILKAQQQSDYVDAVNKSKMDAFNAARLARMREEKRQDRFTNKGYRNLNQTRKDIDAESQKSGMATAQQSFVAANPTDQAYAGLEGDPAAGSDTTIADKARVIADAAGKSRASIANLGALSSFGTVTGDVTNRLQKNADLLAILNNMRKGSLAVYQQEANLPPAEVQPPDTTMADMLTGFGGMFNRGGSSYG
jgi:hypothetical protein